MIIKVPVVSRVLVACLGVSLIVMPGELWAKGNSTRGDESGKDSSRKDKGKKKAIPLPPKRKQPKPGPGGVVLSGDVIKGQIPVKNWKALRDRQVVK